MLQNPRKTLGFKKNMVYKIPPGGGGKPYPASGLCGHYCKFVNFRENFIFSNSVKSHICDIKYSRPISVNDRVITSFRVFFYFHETSHISRK